LISSTETLLISSKHPNEADKHNPFKNLLMNLISDMKEISTIQNGLPKIYAMFLVVSVLPTPYDPSIDTP